ncbi:hypothetical protein [Stakelama tenebrarum]|uniref:Uncharacterized protein n=1 Tax=Stakelama tenebrarum TaxID=2711215 RepID=A0A6G6Y4I2_9SPHN|nr:hypothetical protein [Sphingosinithalassobacter tenebrarum]QIG79513.1 hypothetical protein G5C33_06745 [Sphingosinithalassobacter tenebrarum]
MSYPILAPAGYVPQSAIAFSEDSDAVGVAVDTPLPVSEPSFRGARAISVDSPFAAGRGVAIVADATGELTLRFADESTIVLPVSPGLTILPFAAVEIPSSGTTVPANFWALD